MYFIEIPVSLSYVIFHLSYSVNSQATIPPLCLYRFSILFTNNADANIASIRELAYSLAYIDTFL